MPKATGAPGKVVLGGGGARRRLPKRLRRAVPLFEEMIGRAHRCNIGRLLEAHCPMPQSVRGTKAGKRGAGEGEQPLGPNKREGGFHAAAPPPSPSDVSTLHEEVGEQAEDISAADLWRQEVTAGGNEDAGWEGGGGDNSNSSSDDSEDENKEPEESNEEEDMMDTGSTVKEVRMEDNDSFTVRTHGGVGGISCADGMQGEEEEGIGGVLSSDRASAERAAEPHRLSRGGCADASPWGSVSRRTHESGGGTSGSSSGGDDSGNTSDATLLDEAPTANGASAPPEGVQGSPPRPPPNQPTFSVDPNMTFIEMATEHRRVVDFLCQACHRIFPTELWGSRRNMVCLSRGIERFVVLRRHETMSVLEVTAGMHTSDLEWMAVGAADEKAPPPPLPPPQQQQQQQQDQEPEKTRRVNNGKRKPKGGPVGGDRNCKRPRGGGDAGGAANGADRASADSHGHHGSGRIHGGGGGGRGSVSVEAGGSFPGTSNQDTKRADTSKKKKARGGGKGRVAVGSKRDKSIRRRRRTRQRPPPSDLAKRVELLEALVLWTFKDVIVPLLRSLFYVTECETASQEVFFFRKPVWAKFRTASLRHLTSRQYRRISMQEALQRRDGFAGQGEGGAANRQPFRPLHIDISCTQSGSPTRRRNDGGGATSRVSLFCFGGQSGLGVKGGRGRLNHHWCAFPVSGVRLVPKPNGVRAIANLSKRTWADRSRVQWVKGVPLPLPAPRRVPNLKRATSNASASSGGAGAGARETPRVGGGHLGSEAAGIRRGGRAPRGDRGGWGGGRGGGGGGRSGSSTLLPSTNMQLSNAFHVLKHEYVKNPSLVGAGVFGLDDVFARVKPFVCRNLRPIFCASSSTSSSSPLLSGQQRRRWVLRTLALR
ncbi:unnamed protein product [Ectocarpus sp. 4 AP-2014]